MLKDIFIDGNGGILGAVARFGVPVVLSIGLSVFLVLRVDSALAAVGKTTNENQVILKAAQSTMAGFADTQVTNQRILRNLALQTCLNVAKSDIQQDGCHRAAEK
jgi:hypothetical protein